ncbi:hydrogen peroxide-inducible genes activator [Porphyromonas pogonae]|uniref:hydrogen peroxide-inducible genes activator n=1 Tax=Porphyromonas pogonae TaxID=867595 RepID=UPI002E76C114|nr:hydrogen peroxide-inducible genes activator [Porphyromonas pogonae]
MNLQQLEYICAVNELRHFGKAAELCNVTQPTLSTMIQKLEDELGVKIFDRHQQPIKPTAIGEKILKQAALILFQSSQMQEIINYEEHALEGTVTLAVLPTIAPSLVPLILPNLEKHLPNLNVNIKELMTSECLSELKKGEIELAIIASQADTEGLNDRLLFYEEFFGYVSRNEDLFTHEAIRSSEVNGKRLWLLDEGHCFRDQLVKFCHLKDFHNRKMTYHKGSMETFMRLVEKGNGVTFIPELSIEMLSDEQKKLVRPFTIPKPTREIRVALRNDFVKDQLLDKLCEIIRMSIPPHMLKLKTGQMIV